MSNEAWRWDQTKERHDGHWKDSMHHVAGKRRSGEGDQVGGRAMKTSALEPAPDPAQTAAGEAPAGEQPSGTKVFLLGTVQEPEPGPPIRPAPIVQQIGRYRVDRIL